MSHFRLYSTNWQDGMLITEQHLKDQEKYFEELLRWYKADPHLNYGLVCNTSTNEPSLSLNCLATTGKLQVTVTNCQAITPDGSPISITGDLGYTVRAETPLEDGEIPVYIAIENTKMETGEPDPEEEIPRIPYRVQSYKVYLNDQPAAAGKTLQVAHLIISGNEVGHSNQFFPPCLTVNADLNLSEKAVDFRNRLENLLSLGSRAYSAISSGTMLSGEKTELQAAFKNTVYRIIYHLASSLDQFRVGRISQHPLEMSIYFKRLFRVVSTLFSLEPALKDYLNEKHFTKERKTDIGKFLGAVDSFLLAEYDHSNIGSQVTMIENNLTELRGVLGFLAQTKKEELGREAMASETLTYSGRTYRLAPYGEYRVEQVGELSYVLLNLEKPQQVSDVVVLMSKDLFDVSEWSRMQVRLGLNEARGLGETDPIEIDTTEFGAKVALKPQDMLQTPQVSRITLIFRGASNPSKFEELGKLDLMAYTM